MSDKKATILISVGLTLMGVVLLWFGYDACMAVSNPRVELPVTQVEATAPVYGPVRLTYVGGPVATPHTPATTVEDAEARRQRTIANYQLLPTEIYRARVILEAFDRLGYSPFKGYALTVPEFAILRRITAVRENERQAVQDQYNAGVLTADEANTRDEQMDRMFWRAMTEVLGAQRAMNLAGDLSLWGPNEGMPELERQRL